MSRPSRPEPPTVADLEEYGPAACLAALREEFAEHHKRFPQYDGWTAGTVLGIARIRIGGGSTYVTAEPGDLLLVKRDPDPPCVLAGLYPDDAAYIPRVGWIMSLALTGGIEDINIETEETNL